MCPQVCQTHAEHATHNVPSGAGLWRAGAGQDSPQAEQVVSVVHGRFLDALRSPLARRLLQAAGSGAATSGIGATAAYFAAVEESACVSANEMVLSCCWTGSFSSLMARVICLQPCQSAGCYWATGRRWRRRPGSSDDRCSSAVPLPAGQPDRVLPAHFHCHSL